MEQQNLEEIFLELQKYAGPSLQVFRVVQRLTRKELVQKLRKDLHWNHINVKLLTLIEEGQKAFSFHQCVSLCRTLDVKIIEFLKSMKFLHDIDDRPEIEILKETLEEINYLTWKTKNSK